MSVLNVAESCYLSLAEKLEPGRRDYLPKEKAYELLKKVTGVDFGYDLDQWRQWLTDHDIIHPLSESTYVSH